MQYISKQSMVLWFWWFIVRMNFAAAFAIQCNTLRALVDSNAMVDRRISFICVDTNQFWFNTLLINCGDIFSIRISMFCSLPRQHPQVGNCLLPEYYFIVSSAWIIYAVHLRFRWSWVSFGWKEEDQLTPAVKQEWDEKKNINCLIQRFN